MSPPRNPRAADSSRAPWPDRAVFEQLLIRKTALCGLDPALPELKRLINDYGQLTLNPDGPYLLLARVDPYEGVRAQPDRSILVYDTGQPLRPLTIARYHAARLSPDDQMFTCITIDRQAAYLSTRSMFVAQLNAYALVPVGQKGWSERHKLIGELIHELTGLYGPGAEEVIPEQIVAELVQESWNVRYIMPSTR